MLNGDITARGAAAQAPQWPAMLVRLLLSGYRAVVSPFLGPCCRFVPSCSSYASEAVGRFGVRRGSWMALKRVLRCHPFHSGGWDPVL